jgi:hypothetical protein
MRAGWLTGSILMEATVDQLYEVLIKAAFLKLTAEQKRSVIMEAGALARGLSGRKDFVDANAVLEVFEALAVDAGEKGWLASLVKRGAANE